MAFTAVVRGTPSSLAVSLASLRSFFSILIVKVVFIPLEVGSLRFRLEFNVSNCSTHSIANMSPASSITSVTSNGIHTRILLLIRFIVKQKPPYRRFLLLFSLRLLPQRVVQFVVFRPEEFFGEIGRYVRVVVLAREYIQVHRVRLIRE